MRKLFSIACFIFIIVGLVLQPVEAKRFGGGKSFGYQRQASSYSRQASEIRQTPTAAPVSGASKWLGPLAGLAAGGLLASLFMGKGIGGGILSWLLILGGVFMLWMFIRNRLRPAPQFSVPTENNFAHNTAQFTPVQNAIPSTESTGFDTAAMMRDAKVQFIRLQAAYDTKNLADIREFTSPEVFAEIQLQLQERGDAPNHTEVVKLDAEILDITTEFQQTIVSLSFSGLIRENPNEEAVPFKETWHFKKLNTQPVWLVSGIQQT